MYAQVLFTFLAGAVELAAKPRSSVSPVAIGRPRIDSERGGGLLQRLAEKKSQVH
jgi:hypothetical protein